MFKIKHGFGTQRRLTGYPNLPPGRPIADIAGVCKVVVIDCNEIIDFARTYPLEEVTMASITIRNLEDDIKQRLRVRAAENGRSMEEEARDILRRVMGDGAPPRNLAAAIRARVAHSDRVVLDLPARESMRQPPHFGLGR